MHPLQAQNVVAPPAGPDTHTQARTLGSACHRSSGRDSDDSEETSRVTVPDLPFKGFLLCATGIQDKTSLFELALELGAQSVDNLTSMVTHLIAEEAGSLKYKRALRIGIPIMRPSWIVDSHKIWLQGDILDVAQSIEDHRFPPSLGVGPVSDLNSSNIHKRRRTADPEEPLQNSVVKDTEVWLPDGNVVVVSQNVAFRIHRSILALHSKVFQDLFSLPQPDGAEQLTFEGCPVVRMSDTPEDLRHLFLVLCCGKDYYHENDEIVPVSCEVLCSLIRMGHKFAIKKVLDDALSRLKKHYTSDLSVWEDSERRTKFVTVGATDHLLAIQAAMLTDTPSILPTAFLEMCPYVENHIAALSESTCDAAVDQQSGLTAGRVIQATNGKAALTANVTKRLLAIHTAVPAPQCPTQERCTMVAQQQLRADVRSGIFGYLCTCDAEFRPLYTPFWGGFEDQLCSLCRDESRTADEQLRKSAWKNLPQFFGLQVDEWSV